MGQVGRWIDARCAEEPEVMRRVLNRKFGDLGTFVELDGRCGCLVSSWMLERDASIDRRTYHVVLDANRQAERVGYAVAQLCDWAGKNARERQGTWRKHPDAFVIRLVKQRIRKALGIAPQREAAFTLAQGAET